MASVTLEQLALIVVIAIIIFGTRLHRPHGGTLPRLRSELRGDLPVFSAETTGGKEAEFIRDRLPKRLPLLLLGVALLLVIAAVAWWLRG